MSKASGKVKKKKIYFCTNVILSLMYTWMIQRELGLVLFLLLEVEVKVFSVTRGDVGQSREQGPGDTAHRLCDTAAQKCSPWA